ncbi:MAG: methyltransferase domain-containing protein [Thermoprotei archaeon]
MDGDFGSRMMAAFLQSKVRRIFDPPERVVSLLNVREGMIVADIGCGPGVFSIEIAKRIGSLGFVYAIDSSSYMIKHVESLAKIMGLNNVKTIRTDASDLSVIPSESVDVSIFMYSLHHINRKIDAIREALRITKRGGKIFILDPIWERFFFHGIKRGDVDQIVKMLNNYERVRFTMNHKSWQLSMFIFKE